MTTIPVWPTSLKSSVGREIIWIKPDVPLKFSKQDELSQHAGLEHGDWTETLSTDFYFLLFNNALIPEKLHALHHDFEPSVTAPRIFVSEVIVTIVKCQNPASIQANEQYHIELIVGADDAQINCTISTFEGGLYAVQTLRQLFYKHGQVSNTVLYTPFAPISIMDKPHFAHRGLNLDIARNRIGPKDIMRAIDGMSATKLNRLHLHATDGQSWPLEIPTLPDLAQKGAYHPSQIWTCSDLERVQKHARRRAVDLFVEIDMPGHTASVHYSFPELITAFNQKPWEIWAAEPPAGQLKLNNPKVNEFLKLLMNDLLPRSAKFSNFYHIGGDEINAKAYELDPGVGSSDHDVIRPGMQALFGVVLERVETYGLTPIAWEEVLLDWNIKLPKSTLIQVWRSHERVAQVLEKGHRAIVGPSTHWYLDGGHGSWVDPDPKKKDNPGVKPPFLDWCNPYKNWRQVCSYDPFEGIPAQHHHLVYGGEACLWAELTDSVTFDSKLWPRAAAVAEVLWAGPNKPEIDEYMTRRPAEFRERLVLQGLGAAMVQMEWSLRNFGGSLL